MPHDLTRMMPALSGDVGQRRKNVPRRKNSLTWEGKGGVGGRAASATLGNRAWFKSGTQIPTLRITVSGPQCLDWMHIVRIAQWDRQ